MMAASDLKYSLSLIALTTMLLAITCQSSTTDRYESVKSRDGSPLCVVEQPSKVVDFPMKPGFLRCAKECTKCSTCLVHQVDEAKNRCQLFNYLATNYSSVDKCHAFHAVSDDDEEEVVKTAVLSEDTCSYPFTSDGKLYYSCVPSIISLCDAWCLNMFAQRRTCSKDDYAYVAQNVTIKVRIPVLDNLVPLNSVHRWAVIFSRIDTTFTWNQAYQAYKDGFGDFASNFWLGLTRVYYLTNRAVNGGVTYRLRFELLSVGNSQWYSTEYDGFYLESPQNNFVFHTSSPATGSINDAVNQGNSPTNGSPFRTTGHCPTTLGFWWYNTEVNCCFCRLFGPTGNNGLNWYGIGDLAVARMMIRPAN